MNAIIIKNSMVRQYKTSSLFLLCLNSSQRSQYKQELAKKIQFFEDQIKSRFFTIQVAWRQMQYLTTYYPNYKLGKKYLIDFLVELKREDIINNQPFQVLDGDLLETPKNITKRVFEGMNEKVAIVTVFGPQSSGKSTLLNFLFGCDFGTSEGRCTKGAYGTYFKFSNLRVSGCEGVFLIDTQGLFANTSKKDAEFRKDFDSKLVLFCLAISDFVIINTKGCLDTESTKIIKSSWERFGALSEQNIAWPELNLVLNQNTSSNTITSEGDINKLRDLFKVDKSYSLNQAYSLLQIAKKDVTILFEEQNYVRKTPRQEFLNQTNVLQNSLIQQIEEKSDFKSIGSAIDLMQRVWSTIEAYPDLGKSTSKAMQKIEENIKEWKIKNIEELASKRESLIKQLKSDKISEKQCENQIQAQIKVYQKDYKEKFLSEKFVEGLKQQQKLKIEVEETKCILAFQAIKFQLVSEMKDLEKNRMVNKCKLQGSQYESEARRMVKQIQRKQKRELTTQQKQMYFEKAFQKCLSTIQSISTTNEKLKNYFDRIFQFYSSGVQNSVANNKTQKSAGLPRPEWSLQTETKYQDYSSKLHSYIFKTIGYQSNKYIEIRNNPPTKILDQSSKTDAKLKYFNMRKYFKKSKIDCFYQISKYTLEQSLKVGILEQEISAFVQTKMNGGYGLEEIFHKINKYLRGYFGISIVDFTSFKKCFEYQARFWKFWTDRPELKIEIIKTQNKQGTGKKGQKKSRTGEFVHQQHPNSIPSNARSQWNSNKKNNEEKTQGNIENQVSKAYINIQAQQMQDQDLIQQPPNIHNYIDSKELSFRFKQVNWVINDKNYIVANLQKYIKWDKIKESIQSDSRFKEVIKDANDNFLTILNKDLQPFGIQASCQNFYQYLMKKSYMYRPKLEFQQRAMPKSSKNDQQFKARLQKTDKFNFYQGIGEKYGRINNQYYLTIGCIEQEIFEVQPAYKNTKQLEAYISEDSTKVFYNLKSQQMKKFVFNELSNPQDNAFLKLFKCIDEIILKSDRVLSRNSITSIYIDVANQIKQFNNDLNQVSQKITLLLAGYIHLYAVYMTWKKFSQMAIDEAEKPINDLKAQRDSKLKMFIEETSSNDVTQSNGQCDRFLSQVLNYFKVEANQVKRKINENQTKIYRNKYPRKKIQEDIDNQVLSTSATVDKMMEYLTDPQKIIKAKYDGFANQSLKQIEKEYDSYTQFLKGYEQLKEVVKLILKKIKDLGIEEGTVHTDIFSLIKKSQKEISITDENIREKLNSLVMQFFLDIIICITKQNYQDDDFIMSLNQKYSGLKIYQKPTPLLQFLITKIKSANMSITRLFTFVSMLNEKLEQKETLNNIENYKFVNQISALMKLSSQNCDSFKNSLNIHICKQKCPGCQRICGVQEPHTNKHQCLYGHQMRALGGVKLSNGDASVIRCENVEGLNKVKFNGREMEWSAFMQEWSTRTQGSWCFDDLILNKNTEHFQILWDIIGKKVCQKLQMTWVASNQLSTQKAAMTSSEHIHYIYALDDSGSMSGQKWTDLMKAYQVSINELKKVSDYKSKVKVSVLIQGSNCIKYQENVVVDYVNTNVSARFSGNNFADTFTKAFELMQRYVQGAKVRFIFMTDGGCGYPSTQISNIKSLKNSYPNKIEYYGIQFQTSGDTMKLISQQLGGKNMISYTAQQLTTAYLQIINRDIK